MLYYLFTLLDRLFDIPGIGVFQYITFRAMVAAVFSLAIGLFLGKKIIHFLRLKLIGESIREHGPASHKAKAGTPTMGGLIIIAAAIIPTLLWGNLTNGYVLLVVIAMLWMGAIGFLDDYIKVFKKDKKGLKGKFKIVGQVGLGLIVGFTIVLHPDFNGSRPRVTGDFHIIANETLRKAGFESGDKIIATDNSPIANSISDYQKHSPAKSYTVLRNNGALPAQPIVTIEIPLAERKTIAEQLFGKNDPAFITQTNVPFLKDYVFDYAQLAFWNPDPAGWSAKLIYICIAIFIVTAVSNGVNITDGLDGLAAGTTAIVAITLGLFAYISGNAIFSHYLNITFIPLSGELLVFTTALIGACLAFLWYNSYPAQVFMGDTGSLALGGAIAVLALMVKKELLLPLICGVFFIESLSVILQVSYFKYTKKKYGEGRRIFKMSPLHHHYELNGWHESKIVTRFWIITILLELLAFATLKLR